MFDLFRNFFKSMFSDPIERTPTTQQFIDTANWAGSISLPLLSLSCLERSSEYMFYLLPRHLSVCWLGGCSDAEKKMIADASDSVHTLHYEAIYRAIKLTDEPFAKHIMEGEKDLAVLYAIAKDRDQSPEILERSAAEYYFRKKRLGTDLIKYLEKSKKTLLPTLVEALQEILAQPGFSNLFFECKEFMDDLIRFDEIIKGVVSSHKNIVGIGPNNEEL